MTRCMSRIVPPIFLAALIPLIASPAPGANLPAAPGYLITDLGSLGGGGTVPIAINARGDVVGYSATATGQSHAFFMPVNGTMRDLGDVDGASTFATALNNRGDLVGYSGPPAGPHQPLVLFEDQPIDLGLDRTITTRAVGVNDLRQVLVVQDPGGGNLRSLLWQNGQTTPLGLVGSDSAFASGLNHLGQVVGNARLTDGTNHAFAYDSSSRRLTDLGDIGVGGAMSRVNELSQAVGIRITAAGARIAFGADLRKESGFIEDKVIRRGFSGTQAFGINNEGTTAGVGELTGAAGTNAGVWTADGQFLNLNQLALAPNSGWVLLSAFAINDAGVIVGRAVSPTGELTGYLLTTLGPELAADKATGLASSLDPAIEAVRKGAEAAAAAATPSPLATALIDLQQARLRLTPAAGETSISGAGSAQARRLLTSVTQLLSSTDAAPFLPAADRDQSTTIIAAAQKGLE